MEPVPAAVTVLILAFSVRLAWRIGRAFYEGLRGK